MIVGALDIARSVSGHQWVAEDGLVAGPQNSHKNLVQQGVDQRTTNSICSVIPTHLVNGWDWEGFVVLTEAPIPWSISRVAPTPITVGGIVSHDAVNVAKATSVMGELVAEKFQGD